MKIQPQGFDNLNSTGQTFYYQIDIEFVAPNELYTVKTNWMTCHRNDYASKVNYLSQL